MSSNLCKTGGKELEHATTCKTGGKELERATTCKTGGKELERSITLIFQTRGVLAVRLHYDPLPGQTMRDEGA